HTRCYRDWSSDVCSSDLRYMVRAESTADLDDIRRKVVRCFEAGALATGSRMEMAPVGPPYAEVRHDAELAALYRTNAEGLGRFRSEERRVGKECASRRDR